MAIKGTELASAYVSLSFSTDKLGTQLRNITRNLKDVEVDVDADTKGATTHMEGWRATQQRRPVKIDVDVDTRRARRDVDALSSNLFKLGRSDVLKLNVGAAGIAGLPALATGLGEVTAALQQLSQAALAVPGGIAGAVSSIGTLAFGLTGVTDAYDAVSKAADEAAAGGRNVAQQQRAQQSASFGLRNANVDLAQAQDDVGRAMRDSRRELQDLNLEMRGGIISEKRAVLEAEKARQRLATGDYTDVRDALLDVEEADLRVAETRRRNIRTSEDLTDANRDGIAGSDQVVAANERLIRSEQGVAQAQAAVAASAPGATAAQENAALAMSKLAPNAQEFVNTLMDLQGPVQTLRNLVQDNIFAGLDDQLRRVSGKSMPMLERGLGGIGKAWNRTFTEMFDILGEDDTQGMFERIFGNTEDAQNILTEAIDPLTEGLGTLTEAGTRALPRLAEGFVGASERFSDFITQADEDGRLDEWISEGITALGNLGETALNIGKIFTGIGDAAGGSLLANLERWTTNWANWVNSVEGQQTIQEIFREGKEVFDQWAPILRDIPGLFKGIYEGASTYIGAVTTVVAPITDFLADHPGLVKAAAEAYLWFKGAQVLGAISELTTKLLGLKTLMAVDLPDAARKGSIGISTAMSAIALPLWLSTLIEDKYPNFPIQDQPDGQDKLFPTWVPLLPFWEDQVRNWTGEDAPPSGTGAPPGKDALGSDFFTGGGLMPQIGPSKGSEGGLQINTINVKRAIEAAFPKVPTIGGYRQDPLKWHPNGLALDVMIPGGTTRGGANPSGRAYGDQIWAWLQTHGPAMGVDLSASLWRTDQGGDHFDHIHIATTGGGYPTGQSAPAAGGAAPPPRSAPQGQPSSAPVAGPPAPPPPSQSPLDDWLNGVPKFDQGGWWPDGMLGVNTSGHDEFVLNPKDVDWLTSQGIDPGTLQHGASGGAKPGPIQGQQGGPPLRTEGYLPAAAGNTTPVGEGGLSSILGLGESFFHGLIDTGAQAASMAVSAAAAAGSFGAGAAAGPAASTGIQMGAQAAKRGVSFLYDLGGIWGEALVEQAFPFGAPRWLGSMDPMAFMPQGIPLGGENKAPGTMGTARTAITSWAQPGNPAMASMGNASQGGQAALDAARATPSYTPAAPAYNTQTAAPPAAAPAPAFDIGNPASWLNFGGVFDQGGVLPPQSFGANLTRKPEYVMTQRQFATMAKNAGTSKQPAGNGDTYQFYAQDMDEMFRRYQQEARRKAKRHSGRP